MKTINLIIVSLLLTLNVMSQTKTARDIFVDLLVKECDGYIKSRTVTPKSVLTIITLPSYYDFELVQMSVKAITKEYSDVVMTIVWNEQKWEDGLGVCDIPVNGISINCGITIADKMVIVGYIAKNKTIFVWDNNN